MKGSFVMVAALAWVSALGPAALATGQEVYVKYGESMNAIPWWPHPTLPSVRCQMLYDNSYINYAGTVTEFQLEKSDGNSATFYDVKFYLCHTGLTSLTPTFAQNYGGNTPTMVASFATYKVPAVVGPYPIPMSETFAYNNVDNLLFEVTWESSDKSNIMCRVKNGSAANHRCFAWDYKAEVGTPDIIAYNALIVFDKYPGVAPASLGRIKTLYR
jgi:hypothetical protein